MLCVCAVTYGQDIAARIIGVGVSARGGLDGLHKGCGFVRTDILIGIGCDTAGCTACVGIGAAGYPPKTVIGELNTVYIVHLQGGYAVSEGRERKTAPLAACHLVTIREPSPDCPVP